MDVKRNVLLKYHSRFGKILYFKTKEKSHSLNIDMFKKYIIKRYQTEKYTGLKNMNKKSFDKNWDPFLNLLNNS